MYIDIEYSVMQCEECKETFSMFYYPSSEDIASSTFPPWKESPYIKIDTITANARFENGEIRMEDGINKKTIAIGPLKRYKFKTFTIYRQPGRVIMLVHDVLMQINDRHSA